jgi:uncharacterized protein YkuJ
MTLISYLNAENQLVSLAINPNTFWADEFSNIMVYERNGKVLCDVVSYYNVSQSWAFNSAQSPNNVLFEEVKPSTKAEFKVAFDKFTTYINNLL